MELDEIVAADESEWLDRKGAFPTNRVELLHDILCLANAYAESDRFLLYGITDDRQLRGVSADPNRLNNAQLQDFLRQSNLNRLPTVELRTHFAASGAEIDVLRIANRPDKPFFTTKDRKHDKSVLRSGVIYTRIGETNVPLAESAPEYLVELMWRERFGIGLPALERFHRLLDQPGEWIEVKTRGDYYRYHRVFPEFTVQRGETIVEDFDEPWSRRFPDKRARSYYLEVLYFSTVLESYYFVSCDGGRYDIPLPKRRDDRTFFLEYDTPPMKLAKQIWQYLPLDVAFRIAHVDLI